MINMSYKYLYIFRYCVYLIKREGKYAVLLAPLRVLKSPIKISSTEKSTKYKFQEGLIKKFMKMTTADGRETIVGR
jgi:hypothetical protein